MRRSFPATAGGTPTASSSWMSRRSPLWATFLILTTDAILCRCIASSDTFRKACWATLLGRLPLSGPEPDGRSAPLSPSSWSRRSTRCAGGGAAGRSRRPARSAGGSLRGLRACAGPDLVHGVGRRADWTPIGALTSCFLWTHRGQHRALNNTQSTSSDIWPESQIDCEKSRWEITVEDPEGRPVTVRLPRSKIILCGWVTDGWEMFTFNRKGCILKRKDRFWMRNVDAAKVRNCFR